MGLDKLALKQALPLGYNATERTREFVVLATNIVQSLGKNDEKYVGMFGKDHKRFFENKSLKVVQRTEDAGSGEGYWITEVFNRGKKVFEATFDNKWGLREDMNTGKQWKIRLERLSEKVDLLKPEKRR